MKGGVGFIQGLLAQNSLPGFLAYGAFVGEVVAPILLILGILTRPAALLVVVQMLFAIFLARRGDIFTINPVMRGGGWAIELEMFFLLAALAIFFLGAGRYSLAKRPGRWD
jgi:putative oxidoreductase